MPYYRTLGDGLKPFTAAHSDKLCGNCKRETLFPYKTHRRIDGDFLCEIYCSRCGKCADSFTFGRHTLNTTKIRTNRKVKHVHPTRTN